MKSSINIHSDGSKKNNIKIIKNKNNNKSPFKPYKRIYYPEFSTNQTIKKYIKKKLNDDIIKNSMNDNTLKESNKKESNKKDSNKKESNKKDSNKKGSNKKESNKKDNSNIKDTNIKDSTLKPKKYKSKNIFKKIIGSSSNLKKKQPNKHKMNNLHSTMYNTYNIFNIDNYNAHFYQEYNSCRDNKNNNIFINGVINNNNYNIYNTIDSIHNHIIINTKRHLVNKINLNNKKIRNKSNKNIFNEVYYFKKNYTNHKSYNNILEGNEIYSAIKNLEKYKIKKKGWSIKDAIHISHDKTKNSDYLNQKNTLENNSHEIIKQDNKNIKITKQKIISLKKHEENKKKSIKNTQQQKKDINNNDNKNIKEEKIYINPIIQKIFNNDKSDRRINMKNSKNQARLYSPLLVKYKNSNISINNNIAKIKFGNSNKGKFFFEYQNQIKRNKYI